MKSISFNAETLDKLNRHINTFLENNKIANVVSFSYQYESGHPAVGWNYTAILIYVPLAEYREKQIDEILNT